MRSESVTLMLLAASHLFLAVKHCKSSIIHIPLGRAVGVDMEYEKVGLTNSLHRHGDTYIQPVSGVSTNGYYINISIGTPPQQIQVLIDTGSSNTAVAASPTTYISHFFNSTQSATYVGGSEIIHISYTVGEWEGTIGTDVVTLTTLPNVTFYPSIAFIQHSSNFFVPKSNWQGIVGLAYQSIAQPYGQAPFWDTLRVAAGLADIFSMRFCPSAGTGGPAPEGSLLLGGVMEGLYDGPIFYTPIVNEMYYEVVVMDIAVDSQSLGMDCLEYNFDKTIVDSGTTHLRLPVRVYKRLVQKMVDHLLAVGVFPLELPPERFWKGKDLLCWGDVYSAIALFPDLSISLSSSEGDSQYFTMHMTAQHYLSVVDVTTVSDNQYPAAGTDSCLQFGISPSYTGTVLGAFLMESFLVVFDREEARVGFASSACPSTPSTPGPRIALVDGIHAGSANRTWCQYRRAIINDDRLLAAMTYVMVGVLAVCGFTMLIAVYRWRCGDVSTALPH